MTVANRSPQTVIGLIGGVRRIIVAHTFGAHRRLTDDERPV
ncbi:MAG: hypothetical protein ACTIC1_14070 [Brevibacterium sp.]